MKIITVADQTKHLIDAQVQAGYDLRQTATRLPDGCWTIPVDDEVSTTSMPARLPGETDDDIVSRLLRAAIGREARLTGAVSSSASPRHFLTVRSVNHQYRLMVGNLWKVPAVLSVREVAANMLKSVRTPPARP